MLADAGHPAAGPFIYFLGGAFLLSVLSGPFLMIAINQGLPWAICKRLARRRRPISRRISYSGGAWNPAKPLGRGNPTQNKPGRATYTLTGEGLIQLDIVYTDGRQEHFVGPPVEAPSHAPAARRAGLIPIVTYLAVTGAGFTIGYTVTDESTGRRIESGVFVALIGYGLAWLALTVTSVSWSRRRARTAADHRTAVTE